MNKALILFLILAGLAALVAAKDIPVNVGGANGENVFEPAKVVAAPGDNIVFTWKSGKHSIFQEDALKACAKSASANSIFNFAAYDTATGPKSVTVQAPKDVGKWWFFCAVPGHCMPNTGGMEGTLIVTADGKAPADGGAEGGAAPSGGAGATPSSGAAPGTSEPAKAAASRNNVFTAGALFSGMCMAAAYML